MRVFVLAAAAAFVLTAAHAQTRRDPLLGAWEFQTEPYSGGCTMRGLVTITPGAGAGALSCTMVAHETCPDIKVRAQQTCRVEQRGDVVRITSEIVSVSPDVSYAPDNFELQVVQPGVRMRGMLQSASTAPAEFVRPRAVPVS